MNHIYLIKIEFYNLSTHYKDIHLWLHLLI
nr:MAG TPA_asm: hypothetical protein [Caudoviricetes sp.]